MKLTKSHLEKIIKEELSKAQERELEKLKAKGQQTPDDEAKIEDLEHQ